MPCWFCYSVRFLKRKILRYTKWLKQIKEFISLSHNSLKEKSPGSAGYLGQTQPGVPFLTPKCLPIICIFIPASQRWKNEKRKPCPEVSLSPSAYILIVQNLEGSFHVQLAERQTRNVFGQADMCTPMAQLLWK